MRFLNDVWDLGSLSLSSEVADRDRLRRASEIESSLPEAAGTEAEGVLTSRALECGLEGPILFYEIEYEGEYWDLTSNGLF